MQNGPQPFTHEERLATAREIAEKFRAKYGAEVRAIGAYGSLARGTDGPYSDIEMFCILHGEGIDTSYEWCEGDWKAEVDVQSADVLFDWARELDETWALTHGCLLKVLPFYDPENLFMQLPGLVFAHETTEFDAVIAQFIVDDVFELMGKLHNAVHARNHAAVPNLAIALAKSGAFIIGLANRHLYSTSTRLFAESLELPDRPDGYDELCRLVMEGDLSSPAIIHSLSTNFWNGLERWALAWHLKIYTTLDELLRKDE